MPAGKGRYTVGAKGTHGCNGYPVVGGEGKVHGCHATEAEAQAQQAAIYASQAAAQKSVDENESKDKNNKEIHKSRSIVENHPDCNGFAVIGNEGDLKGCYDSREAAQQAINEHDMNDNEDGHDNNNDDMSMALKGCCPDEASVGKADPCWEGYTQRGMKPGDNGAMVPNCVPVAKADDFFEDSDDVVYETDSMEKADGYSPPAGARSAARRAIKFKEDGKANGAGTAVGWTRARQLANGETLSLSTVKRMYSYFSRHEVDKKGKDWGNQANPSNGYIMWLAWGGDAGFSWSRSIVNREMDKSIFSDFGKDYTKTTRIIDIR